MIDQQVIYLMAQLISKGKSNTHAVNWGKKPKGAQFMHTKSLHSWDFVSTGGRKILSGTGLFTWYGWA